MGIVRKDRDIKWVYGIIEILQIRDWTTMTIYMPAENCNNGGFKQCLMDCTDLNDWKELQSKVWASYPQLWRFPATVQFNQFSYCWFTGLLLYFKLWFLNVFRWYSDFITFFFQKMMNSKVACSQCHHMPKWVDNRWLVMAFLGSSGKTSDAP